MKQSIYNHIRKEKDGYILYNSATGAIIFLTIEQYKFFYNGDFEEIDNEKLIELGFIVDEGIDEIKIQEEKRKSGSDRAKYDRASYTIAPTLKCNARCWYCYEKDTPHFTMSEEVVNKTIEYIKNDITKLKSNSLKINWFGGEPLLAQDIIWKMSKELIEFIGKENYSANIVSNGSLINEEVINNFLKWQITQIQITLDGTENYYNEYKAYVNKQHNYKLVINNIEKLLKKGIRVSVRLNFNDTNLLDIMKAINEVSMKFKKYEKFFMYVYPIKGVFDDKELSTGEVLKSNLEKSLLKLYQNGFIKEFSDLNLNPVKTHCSARISAYRIDPLGNIYNCNHDIGKSNLAVGNIFDGIDKNNKNYLYYTNTSIDKRCEECSLLPICQGGCLVNTNEDDLCVPQKSSIDTLLHIAYIIRGRENNNE